MAERFPVHATEVDGVPVLWADTGEDLATLSLMFRVGHCDETFRRVGLTHLVEHLTLNAVGMQPYDWNGFVDMIRCGFHATGRPEELVEFVATVCRALRELPTDRLARERNVLHTEALSRTRDFTQKLLWYRFGARHHGLSGLPEWALWSATIEEAQAWADARFTRRNAALWYLGPLPSDLHLPLPEGTWLPPVEVAPISPLPLPSVIGDPIGGAALGILSRRSFAISFAAALGAQLARDRLRLEEGIAREVQVTYGPLTADRTHVAWFVPALPEHTDAVRTGLVEVLQRLAAEGPPECDLERIKEQGRRAWFDRRGLPAWLDHETCNRLLGAPPTSREEYRQGMDAVSPGAIASVLAEAFPSALLMLPYEALYPGDPFQRYPTQSSGRIGDARVYTLVPRPVQPSNRFRRWFGFPDAVAPQWPRLLIGREGVSHAFGLLEQVTVRAETCVGYLCGKPGERTIVGVDGFSVHVVAGEWIDGEAAIRELDEIFPRSLWIDA